MITADAQRQFVKDVAWAFSGTPFEEVREDGVIALVWKQGEISAGASVNAEEAWVWLGEAAVPVNSSEDAVGLLGAIFADEIVTVNAFEQVVFIANALANACDLHLAPHLLVPIDPRTIARIDALKVQSWSGAKDATQPWPRED